MQFLAKSFADMKVSAKVMAGFVVVLLITTAIAATGYTALSTVRSEFEAFSQQVKTVGIAQDLEFEFTDYRRHIQDFALSGDDDSITKATAKRKELEASLTKGISATKHSEERAKFVEIQNDLAEYDKNVDDLVKTERAMQARIKDILDPAGERLRLDIATLVKSTSAEGNTSAVILANAAMEQLMLARLSANKLLARREVAQKQTAELRFADLDLILAQTSKVISSPESRKIFDETVATLKTYRDAFAVSAGESARLHELVAVEMNADVERIAAAAQEIKKSGIEEEEKVSREAAETINTTQLLSITLSVGGLLFGALLAWLIGRAISTPIRSITAVFLELANGNKTVDVPYADRGDEVGENARAAIIFKENLLRIEQMQAESKMAETRAAEQRKAEMHRIADDFQRAVGSIVSIVSTASGQLETAATSLTKTAESTQQLSGMVAAASEQTSANVHGVAAASEQLSSTVTEISRQVQEGSIIANSAVVQAEKTNANVAVLSQSAERIGNVVGLISNIAGQTNLLALNATIEAARAGEAGKGFAVVAQEVKALADQTGKATSEISAQIAGMQTATRDAVGAIQEISKTINRISEITAAIAAAVEQQGATTQEISRNVSEAAKGTSEVASSIIDVSKGAEETGSASSQVLSSARTLSGESRTLKTEVEKFLATVRAA